MMFVIPPLYTKLMSWKFVLFQTFIGTVDVSYSSPKTLLLRVDLINIGKNCLYPNRRDLVRLIFSRPSKHFSSVLFIKKKKSILLRKLYMQKHNSVKTNETVMSLATDNFAVKKNPNNQTKNPCNILKHIVLECESLSCPLQFLTRTSYYIHLIFYKSFLILVYCGPLN